MKSAEPHYTSDPTYVVTFYWDKLSLRTPVRADTEEQAVMLAVANKNFTLSPAERLSLGSIQSMDVVRVAKTANIG